MTGCVTKTEEQTQKNLENVSKDIPVTGDENEVNESTNASDSAFTFKTIPSPTYPTFPVNFKKEDVWKIKDKYENEGWKSKEAFETSVWKEKERVENLYWKKLDSLRGSALQTLKDRNLNIYYQYLDAKETGKMYQFENSERNQDFKVFLLEDKKYSKEYSQGLKRTKEYYSKQLEMARSYYSKLLENGKDFYSKNK